MIRLSHTKEQLFTIPVMIVLTLSLLSSCSSANTDPPVPFNEMNIPDTSGDTWTPGEGYEPAWEDEFNGPGIDTSVWSYETWDTGWRHEWNGEWQDYVDNGTGGDNAFIQDGVLVIKASMKESSHGIHAYDSIRMVTKDKKSWQYGKIAARMALPFGQGIWPALWMLGNEGQWPASGEIDILELIGGDGSGAGNDNEARAALHWADTSGEHAHAGSIKTAENLRVFHVFELEWTADTVRIGIDGDYYFEKNIQGEEFDEFRKPFYLLLNLAVGGTWGGYPDEITAFPQYLYVDWIRVYQ
ncbi:MAG: glycoside hydrolase family 16 protein [Spirochaetales bacterium]|nr:glycoside hydrolase family 16 protein [Spirochaetales bacterium]